MKFPRHNAIILCILGILLILKLGILFWSLDKGFDLVDEGHHLLAYNFPDSYRYIFHNYHLIISEIFFFIDLNISNLRLLGIVSELIAIAVFTYGVYKWLEFKNLIKKNEATLLYLFLFTALSSFLSIQDRVFAYNAFTNFDLLVSSGLLFLSTTLKNKKIASHSAITVSAFFSGLQLFIKFPASLLIITFSLIWLVANKRWSRTFATMCAAYFMGIGLSISFFFMLTGFKVDDWISHFVEGFRMMKTWGYGTVDFYISCYLMPLFALTLFTIPSLIVFFASRKFINTLKQKSFIQTYWNFIAIVPFLASMLTFLAEYRFLTDYIYNENIYAFSDSTMNMTIYLYLIILVELLFSAKTKLMNDYKSINHKSQLILFQVFLFTLPFIIIFAAMASIDNVLFGCLFPWFLLIAIYTNPYENTGTSILKKVLVLAVILISQAHFINNYIFHPTRLLTNLPAQNNSISGIDEVQLDNETFHFFENIKKSLEKGQFKKGQPIVALSNMPGIVYLVGGYSPFVPHFLSVPWHPDFEHFQIAYNCNYFMQLKQLEQRPYILLNSAISQGNIDCLKNASIGFPDNYELLDSILNPYKEREISAKLYPDSVSAWTFVFKPINGILCSDDDKFDL